MRKRKRSPSKGASVSSVPSVPIHINKHKYGNKQTTKPKKRSIDSEIKINDGLSPQHNGDKDVIGGPNHPEEETMGTFKIKRFNKDSGNSVEQFMVNGYYFEIITNVVELSEKEAYAHFTSRIDDPKDFLKNILISTVLDDQERFFLVGEAAEEHQLGNKHISKLHNKAESEIPYICFLAGTAYYQILQAEDSNQSNVEIDYFSTMLPIWLLKKADKFSEMQEQMAARFHGEHNVTIMTPGAERTLSIKVATSKCRIEGADARWAIKKNFKLEDNELADQFNDFDTLMHDIGGGTCDLALLPAGLKAPKNRSALESLTDISYLKHIETLRTEKLLEFFPDVRSLEKFIYENINNSKMELLDGSSGKMTDLTKVIYDSLRSYAKIYNAKVENTFPLPQGRMYKNVYIGGNGTVLKKFIEEAIKEKYGEEIQEQYHIFLPDAGKLNLYALEILSLNETAVAIGQ
jgi:plasmid segregation protein ParM